MATVKILMNAMPGHISVRLRKIVIIKYHFISVPVTWVTLTIRMVIALILTSALMAITTVTQMPSVLIVMAVIHVVVILGIVRVSMPNISQFILVEGITLSEIFLTAGHQLTVSNGVILCTKNNAIKKIGFIWVSCAGAMINDGQN